MNKLQIKLERLELMLVEDGYNTSNIVLQTLIEAQKEAINYTPCCTQLKDKETPSFEDWLITMQIQKKGRLYFAKDGIEQDFNALHRRYVQTLQEQYF
ncbi:hypothetical protein GUB10_00010 [Salegentibacter sp. BLCTC]|uniref:hypothetical protein n=1 Tax=Salegentibacter sp. BLCTC TaxID=2697368 RepID=UPI00187B411E|nr:hypothetical protein [Salegentibacter sp. BLCTC]MBE7638703.1 hypothetical protein [Salegentibacter sp. BLCTC]